MDANLHVRPGSGSGEFRHSISRQVSPPFPAVVRFWISRPQRRPRNLLADDGEASALVTAIALQNPSERAIYIGTVRRR